MRHVLLILACISCAIVHGAPFTIHVTARGLGADVVSLYRYSDLFTLRTTLVTRGLLDNTGQVILEGDAQGTVKMQLRIGERFADLYVRPGSALHVSTYDLGTARSLNGTTKMGLEFKDIDALDVNALTTDLNERIDAFVAEDLATDQAAGMQALDIQRKQGTAKPDSTVRPATLFITPTLSKAKLDSFATKLHAFYKEVHDPWFAHYLDYGIAGLYLGPRVHERDLFEQFMEGKNVLYDDPEYVRFTRNLFADGLEQLARYKNDSLLTAAAQGDARSLRRLFQANDFLRSDDRLAELVMIDQLYLDHAKKLVPFRDTERILADVTARSEFAEHRNIAANMLWDLTVMRVGSTLPHLRVEDARGRIVDLNTHLSGPVCVAFTAGWCTYCAPEINTLVKLAEEYKGVVAVIIVSLDGTLNEFNAGRKGVPSSEQVLWLHAVAEQELRDDMRLKSLPAFYLLNDSTVARAPAPLPSKGLAELFFKAKTEAEKGQQLKVWDD
ncbi:MAG: redoxin domain-containing protein [Flavobacteriales bacterium]|nr:redoxin domain-containing protein [Flavobacteriales bacterium]